MYYKTQKTIDVFLCINEFLKVWFIFKWKYLRLNSSKYTLKNGLLSYIYKLDLYHQNRIDLPYTNFIYYVSEFVSHPLFTVFRII